MSGVAFSDLKRMTEEFNEGLELFKKKNDTRLELIESKLEVPAQLKEEIAKINKELDERQNKYLDALKDLEAKVNASPDQPGVSDEKKEIFLKWCRFGSKALKDTERKLLIPDSEFKGLSAGVDTEGGFLCPDEFNREIIKGMIEFSPVRKHAWVKRTSNRTSKFPKRTGTFAATWVAEKGTRSDTTGLAYGLEEIPNHEMYAQVPITFEELEDSAFDMEAELRKEFSEQFGVAEGAAFIGGDAVSKPEGITTASGTNSENVDDNSGDLIDGGDLIDCYYGLNTLYANNGTWFFNRTTIGQIRQLRYDAVSAGDQKGGYVIAPITVGGPFMILGRPVEESTNLDAAGQASKKVGIFGDIRRAYAISDRIPIQIARDPYTQADNGQVKFTARKRVGGQVILPEALIILSTQA